MAKKTVSDAAKSYLRVYHEGTWKRLNKVTLSTGAITRDFECLSGPLKGEVKTVLACEEDPECDSFYELSGTQVYFGIHQGGMLGNELNRYNVCFTDQEYWDENHAVWDEHVEARLTATHGLPVWCNDESMENNFVVPKGITIAQIIKDLTALGFKFHPELNKFLNR